MVQKEVSDNKVSIKELFRYTVHQSLAELLNILINRLVLCWEKQYLIQSGPLELLLIDNIDRFEDK